MIYWADVGQCVFAVIHSAEVQGSKRQGERIAWESSLQCSGIGRFGRSDLKVGQCHCGEGELELCSGGFWKARGSLCTVRFETPLSPEPGFATRTT